jgi:glutamine synthetase
MKSSNARQAAIQAVTTYKSPEKALDYRETPAHELFACNVFSERVMRERLPKSIFKTVQNTIRNGAKLGADVAPPP